MTRTSLIATAALSLALASCGSSSTGSDSVVAPSDAPASLDSMPGGEASMDATVAADDRAAASASMDASGNAMPLTGQAFVDAMAASDTYEMEAARLAQSKGVTGDVRGFAQMMIRDHSRSSENLRKATNGTKGVTLRDTPTMTAEQRDMIGALQGATAAEFPRVYLQQQVAAHQKALAMLQTYGQSGDVRPLMDFANTTAKVVQGHLDQARKLSGASGRSG